jgi:hypothetical protein
MANFGTIKQENFMGKLIQHSANVGFQFGNRFIAMIHGPGLSYLTTPSGIQNGLLSFVGSNGLGVEEKKRLAITCVEASLGGKGMDTEEYRPYSNSPTVRMPVREEYTPYLTLTFLCSSDFFERKYFTAWNQKIIDPTSHMVELYENYAKPWKILIAALPRDVGSFDTIAPVFSNGSNDYTITGEGKDRNDTGRVEHMMYYSRFCECYPVVIEEVTMDGAETKDMLKVRIRFHYQYIEDPVSVYMDARSRQYDQVAFKEEPLSPFEQFKKILRDVARYSNPKELRQLVVDRGFGILNETFGIENVERVAKAGQIIDVYRRTPNKNYQVTQSRLIGPLGDII